VRSTLRRGVPAAIAVVLALVSVIPVAAAPADVRASDAKAHGGRLIVLWRDHAPADLGIGGVRRMAKTPMRQRSVITAMPGQAGVVARDLRRDPRVLSVVPDARIKAADWPADPPDDPRYGEQDDLDQINVPDAWPTTTGDPGVVVAVIDSGVDLAHPDLAGVAVTDPRNEIWNTTDVTDDLGHGTHVAGTIFAQTDNTVGIAGIAPTSTLMPIKVLDESGFGSVSDLLDGMDWARTHGADIINISITGFLTPEQVALVQPTFTAARAAGILTVAAAGNSGERLVEYPGALRGVVSVSAVDETDALAEFSSFNRGVDLAAPGVETLSTALGDYERASGTSMASPHVAGGAALVWSARPGLDVAELEAVLRESSLDLGDPGRDDRFGSGRLDVLAALSEPVPDPLPDLEPEPGITDPLEFTFTSPTVPVTQTKTSFTVSWTASHEVIAGQLARYRYFLIGGVCPSDVDFPDDLVLLDFTSPITDTGLAPGSCYRWSVIGIDEEAQIADAISAPVTVVDRTRPTIRSRTPRPGATGVSRTSNIKVTFSEAVRGVSSTTVRLKNLRTGFWVRAKVTYSSSTRTATLDPALSMYRNERYAVYVTSGIRDIAGNRFTSTSWSFRTRP
jgi:subtilisin family serine protease